MVKCEYTDLLDCARSAHLVSRQVAKKAIDGCEFNTAKEDEGLRWTRLVAI